MVPWGWSSLGSSSHAPPCTANSLLSAVPPAAVACAAAGGLPHGRIAQFGMAEHVAASWYSFRAVQWFRPASSSMGSVPIPPAILSSAQLSPCASAFNCLNKSKMSFLCFVIFMVVLSLLGAASIIDLPVHT